MKKAAAISFGEHSIPRDIVTIIVKYVLFSSPTSVSSAYAGLSHVCKGLTSILYSLFTRADWLQRIEQCAPQLNIQLEGLNLGPDVSDQDIANLGKAILTQQLPPV